MGCQHPFPLGEAGCLRPRGYSGSADRVLAGAHQGRHGGLRSQYTHVNDVAATLYEVAGIEVPSAVDGVRQKSLDGVSFAYSFTDAHAPSRHTVQVYEQWGNRSIYQDGWIAAARHIVPWAWSYGDAPDDYDRDQWQLYHLDEDFSEARNPGRSLSRQIERPQAAVSKTRRRGETTYTRSGEPTLSARLRFRPGGTGSSSTEPCRGCRPGKWPISTRSHRISAEIGIPERGAEGIIVSDGSRYGGFALYVKNGHLVYERATTRGDGDDRLIRNRPAQRICRGGR